MAVAIANWYLNEAFRRADDRNNDNNDNDDDDMGVEDSALDLQAGHGMQVAGMIYGRLYQEALAEDWGGRALTKRRRTATTAADEEFEGQRRQRFTRLQLANAAGQLQQMIGDLQAAFCGQQERVIWSIMRIQLERVQVFCKATTQRNIEYGVVIVALGSGGGGCGCGAASRGRWGRSGLGLWSGQKGEDGELSAVEERGYQEVRDWLRQKPCRKAVVYSSMIEGVKRMAEALGCAAFHSSISSIEDKVLRLEAWRRGDSADRGVIVAMNALGLGIDVLDMRLVVHAGMLRRLWDFVQESSRAAVEEKEVEKEKERALEVMWVDDGDGDMDRDKDGDREVYRARDEEIRAAFESSQQARQFRWWQARAERSGLGEEGETFKQQLA
ncbi:hypothetical protein CKAH01_11878 [Colletotrichum kahawae]|uniref:DNA 3'-5' helicase n=1 Tax=Colletotrichum kahawae TaxID=34407 RepID=A0AAD9YTK6_COLKA|nr:hypothetical protein CKAH01_11878 [Colletotrichum kahawae]